MGCFNQIATGMYDLMYPRRLLAGGRQVKPEMLHIEIRLQSNVCRRFFYHVVKRVLPYLVSGSTVAVVGAGECNFRDS